MKTCSITIQQLSVSPGELHQQLSADLLPDAFVVSELTDEVRIRRLRDFSPPWKKIIRVRAFDPTRGEVLLERHGEILSGRSLMESPDGEECTIREGRTLCFGKVQQERDNAVLMGEARIKSYTLPIIATRDDNVMLHHRDYIRFDDDGAAYVFANRAVDFSVVENKSISALPRRVVAASPDRPRR